MRKRGLIIAVLGLLLFVLGCSKVTTSKTDTQSIKTVKSVDYTQLSQSQKNEMRFSFERRDETDMSIIDVTVVNRTSEDVQFDGTRFVLAHTKGSDVTSTKGEPITVKSNSTKKFKSLFSGVDDDDFKTVGLFYYKNTKNKLAYSEIDTTISKSTNLKDTDLQKLYRGKPKKKITAPTKTDENDNQVNNNRQTRPAVPTGPITNAQQAIALVESQYGPAPEGLQYTHMTDETVGPGDSIKNNGQMVYWVRLFREGNGVSLAVDDWTVYPDRTVIHQAPGELDESNGDSDNDDSNNNDYDSTVDTNDDYDIDDDD